MKSMHNKGIKASTSSIKGSNPNLSTCKLEQKKIKHGMMVMYIELHRNISFKYNDFILLYRVLYQCAPVLEVNSYYHRLTGYHVQIAID